MPNSAKAQFHAILATLPLPQGISIRLWDEKDFPVIQRLSDRAGWSTPTERPNDALRAWHHSSPTLLATSDEEVIGFVRAITDGAVTMYICELLVAPEWRSMGIGSALLDACHALYSSTRLDLLSTESADVFYGARGFQAFRGFRKSYR